MDIVKRYEDDPFKQLSVADVISDEHNWYPVRYERSLAPSVREGCSLTLHNNRVLLFGENDGSGCTNPSYEFRPREFRGSSGKPTWRKDKDLNKSEPLANHTVVERNGKLYM